MLQQDFSEPKYTSPTKTDSRCKGKCRDLDQSVLKLLRSRLFNFSSLIVLHKVKKQTNKQKAICTKYKRVGRHVKLVKLCM